MRQLLGTASFGSFLIVCAMVAVGCGGGAPPMPSGIVPVTGTVTLDGEPVSGAIVTFVPVQITGGGGAGLGAASGMTDSTGKYSLIGYEGRANGTLPGSYRVKISRLTRADGSTVIPGPDDSPMQLLVSGAREQLPEKYSSDIRTSLVATVDPSGSPVDFKLFSK
jgi:hypothetical protein